MKYEPSKYWEERLSSAGLGFCNGVGYKGVDEEEQIAIYRKNSNKLLNKLKELGIALEGKSVLDVGCGNGFYAKILLDKGVNDYIGIDITDALFKPLRQRFPDFVFIKWDITDNKFDLHKKFDIIFMLDVTQHIVKKDKLIVSIENIKRHLKKGGYFISTTWNTWKVQQDIEYEVKRPFKIYQEMFKEGYENILLMRYRDKFLYIMHKL